MRWLRVRLLCTTSKSRSLLIRRLTLPAAYLMSPAPPQGFFPGHDERVAVVCVGEKGHLNVEMRVEVPAGHSSVPPVSVPTTGG